MSPSILTNILVLSTLVKEQHDFESKEQRKDFWNTLEPELMLKMTDMELGDLINLMWSALEVKKGS